MQQGDGARRGAATHKSEAVELRLTCEVAATADAMRTVRTQLRELLTQWRLEDRTANAVLDVTHELLVNAHQHGTAPVQLTLEAGTAEIRAAVRDCSASPARLLAYRPGVSDHGLGLQLVRQLSSQWGQTTHDDGKSVWAVFERRAPRSPSTGT
jgi:two-component sensor histidine kinase